LHRQAWSSWQVLQPPGGEKGEEHSQDSHREEASDLDLSHAKGEEDLPGSGGSSQKLG